VFYILYAFTRATQFLSKLPNPDSIEPYYDGLLGDLVEPSDKLLQMTNELLQLVGGSSLEDPIEGPPDFEPVASTVDNLLETVDNLLGIYSTAYCFFKCITHVTEKMKPVPQQAVVQLPTLAQLLHRIDNSPNPVLPKLRSLVCSQRPLQYTPKVLKNKIAFSL
jgi:hypothetical protein